jgi:hypothetical protein
MAVRGAGSATRSIDAIVAAHAGARAGFAGYLGAWLTIWKTRGRAVLFEDGRASVELVTAIYDAARSGRP